MSGPIEGAFAGNRPRFRGRHRRDFAKLLSHTPYITVLPIFGVKAGDAERVARCLRELRSLGVKLAVDDFGTGYSSLSYLADFPIDVLKIDKSFVGRLGRDGRAAGLVRVINDLSTLLGLQTIAEGIECSEHRDELAGLGVALGQGFYFSEPLPCEDAALLLDEPARPSFGAGRRENAA